MIWKAHYSRVIRHFGVEKTVAVLQKYFYWSNLRQDVKKYIRSSISISMDYMSCLPSNKHGNNCVFVVVDKFSKMAIIAAYKKNITVKSTAKLFFEQVWVHFGIPQSIISD